MSLIAFRRGRDQAGRWADGRLREEPRPGPAEASPGAADPGAEARSFYESVTGARGGAEPRNPNRDPQNPNQDPQNPNRDPQNPHRDPQNPNRDPQNPHRDPQNLNRDPQNLNRDPQNPNRDPQNPDRDPAGEAQDPPSHFCRSCGASFRDPPGQHRRSTAHLLGLGAAPVGPGAPVGLGAPPGPGLRLLLRWGWAGAGLGPGGRGRLLPVPTELKRDRAGLGWGRLRARVSHFGPGDAAAVAGPSRGSRGGFGEGARGGSRARFRSPEEERGWEIRLREYMEREEPPERPRASRRAPETP